MVPQAMEAARVPVCSTEGSQLPAAYLEPHNALPSTRSDPQTKETCTTNLSGLISRAGADGTHCHLLLLLEGTCIWAQITRLGRSARPHATAY